MMKSSKGDTKSTTYCLISNVNSVKNISRILKCTKKESIPRKETGFAANFVDVAGKKFHEKGHIKEKDNVCMTCDTCEHIANKVWKLICGPIRERDHINAKIATIKHQLWADCMHTLRNATKRLSGQIVTYAQKL